MLTPQHKTDKTLPSHGHILHEGYQDLVCSSKSQFDRTSYSRTCPVWEHGKRRAMLITMARYPGKSATSTRSFCDEHAECHCPCVSIHRQEHLILSMISLTRRSSELRRGNDMLLLHKTWEG